MISWIVGLQGRQTSRSSCGGGFISCNGNGYTFNLDAHASQSQHLGPPLFSQQSSLSQLYTWILVEATGFAKLQQWDVKIKEFPLDTRLLFLHDRLLISPETMASSPGFLVKPGIRTTTFPVNSDATEGSLIVRPTAVPRDSLA